MSRAYYLLDNQRLTYRPDLPERRKVHISDEKKALVMERMNRYGESYHQALRALKLVQEETNAV